MGKIVIFGIGLLVVAGFGVSVTSASSSEVNGQETHNSVKKKGPTITYRCPPTAPRYNLNLTRMMGQWYPILLTKTAATLWSESFQNDHPESNTTKESCFFVDYDVNVYETYNMTLHMKFSRGNQFTNVDAFLIADENHPTFSKWVVEWPTGERTLTSIVATGTLDRSNTRYTWLLIVDCDVTNVVRPDWIILLREEAKISQAGLNAIKSVVEGLHGLMRDEFLRHEPRDCRN